MFNVNSIKEGLINLVAWRQNIDPNGYQLTELMSSESGLYYNDVYPLLTFKNLQSIAPQYDLIADATANFEGWLKERTEQGIIQLINSWLQKKIKNRTARNLLARRQLFQLTGNFADLVDVKDYRVGFEILPYHNSGVIQRITQIGLHFTQNQTIPIKLFQSGRKIPLFESDFVYTGNGSVQWFNLSEFDGYWEMKGDAAYYLLYDLNQITGNPINGIYRYDYGVSGRTNRFCFNKFFGIHGTKTDNPLTELGNLTNHEYDYATNNGINLRFDVRTDYTDFILEQKDLFATALQKQVGVNMLQELAANAEARVNRNINIDWQKIQFALYGDTQTRNKAFGLIHELNQSIDSIQFDTTGIDAILLPKKRKGVRFTTV